VELTIGNLWMCASCLSSIVAALFFHEPMHQKGLVTPKTPHTGVAQAGVMIYKVLHGQSGQNVAGNPGCGFAVSAGHRGDPRCWGRESNYTAVK
jgi:hypothetical protein